MMIKSLCTALILKLLLEVRNNNFKEGIYMSQQIKYSIIFTVLILTQVICIIKAHKSEKPVMRISESHA